MCLQQTLADCMLQAQGRDGGRRKGLGEGRRRVKEYVCVEEEGSE